MKFVLICSSLLTIIAAGCGSKGTNVTDPGIKSLNCPGATKDLIPTAGSPYSYDGTIPYLGGNGYPYATRGPFASTGVTGLSMTIPAGTLAAGTGNLPFRITGTASGVGYAFFPINFYGLSCSVSLFVRPADGTPPSITALNCVSAAPTVPVNVGIPASGKVTLPYSGANAAIYPAGGPIASTGLTGLTISLISDTLDYGDGKLEYNLSGSVSSTGVASFPVTFAGKSCTINIPVN